MRTVAVVLAGGSGRRFGGELPKQLRLLAGRTLVEHCVAAFDQAPGVDDVLVVIGEEFVAETAAQLGPYRKLIGVIPGGAARSDSTRQAIAALRDRSPGAADSQVLLHDAARPLVDQRIIADCVLALRTHEAVGVVVPASDTIVIVDGDVMTSMPRRDRLRRCQTPQGFRLPVIRRAYELAQADPAFADQVPTDDCGVVLRYLPEVAVAVVPGSERNFKITYPDDLRVAESLLSH
jgi:2-C-methyl-D-erythritol 4-phosphate cytidylyltransferase